MARLSTHVTAVLARGLTRLSALGRTVHAHTPMTELEALVSAAREVFPARHATRHIGYVTRYVVAFLEEGTGNERERKNFFLSSRNLGAVLKVSIYSKNVAVQELNEQTCVDKNATKKGQDFEKG